MDQSRPRKPLSPVQRKAALALASGERHDHVASDARVTRRTLYRWMRRPEFSRVMDGAIHSFHESCRPETAAARLQAFRTLIDMSVYCKPDERVRAANSLLAYLDRHETSPERRKKWRSPKKSRT
jgi:hypothetical protein